MSIVLLGSTSGSCTLQEQAVAGNTVLTLPTTSGTVLTSTSSSSDLPSSIKGPAFSAYRNGTQSAITSGVFTKVQLNAEEFDTANCFDSTTNFRFTPNVAGYYQINGAVSPSAFSGNYLISLIYKNGSIYKNGANFAPNSAAGATTTVSSLVYLNGTTDYVELYILAQGTPFLNGTQVADTYFNGAMVRAA